MVLEGHRMTTWERLNRPSDEDWKRFWEEIEAQKAGQLGALLERRKRAQTATVPLSNVVSMAAWKQQRRRGPNG